MTKTKVAVFSLRWWLEDRKTGKLVVAQRPNLLLALAIAGLLLTRLLPSSLLAVVLAKLCGCGRVMSFCGVSILGDER